MLILLFIGFCPILLQVVLSIELLSKLANISQTSQILSIIKHHAWQEYYALLFEIIAVVVLGFLITKYVFQRLLKVVLITKKISNEDFSEKIKIHTNDEIGELGKAINRMFDKLKQNKLLTLATGHYAI